MEEQKNVSKDVRYISYDKEVADTGYYMVDRLNSNVKVHLTSIERYGMHRYTDSKKRPHQLAVGLKPGQLGGCAICPKYN